MGDQPRQPALCVDLDGTLMRGDSLILSLRRLLSRKPWTILQLLASVRHGRARFKRFVAERFVPDPSRLPYRTDVLSFLRAQKEAGRSLILATAADALVGRAVAEHLGVFERVIASDGKTNCRGSQKLAAIREQLGDAEFDYVGDSIVDLPVFKAARKAFLVCPSANLLGEAENNCKEVVVLAS